MLCKRTDRQSESEQDSSPESTVHDWQEQKADNWVPASEPAGIRAAVCRRNQTCGQENNDNRSVYREKITWMFWQMEHGENIFKVKPEVFTREEKRAWLDQMKGVTLGSDAFFPVQ